MARKTARRHEQGEASRARILDATLVLAAERGYDGTSVALVTEATGLPASSIYWHFGNKDELLAATLEHSYRRWRQTAEAWSDQLEDGPGEIGDQIRDRLRRAATAITDSPEFWRLGLMLALERRLVEPAARRRFLVVRRETREGITTWWRHVLDPGVVDDETVARLARFHVSIMDGLYIGERAAPGADRTTMIDLIAAGMVTHAINARTGA